MEQSTSAKGDSNSGSRDDVQRSRLYEDCPGLYESSPSKGKASSGYCVIPQELGISDDFMAARGRDGGGSRLGDRSMRRIVPSCEATNAQSNGTSVHMRNDKKANSLSRMCPLSDRLPPIFSLQPSGDSGSSTGRTSPYKETEAVDAAVGDDRGVAYEKAYGIGSEKCVLDNASDISSYSAAPTTSLSTTIDLPPHQSPNSPPSSPSHLLPPNPPSPHSALSKKVLPRSEPTVQMIKKIMHNALKGTPRGIRSMIDIDECEVERLQEMGFTTIGDEMIVDTQIHCYILRVERFGWIAIGLDLNRVTLITQEDTDAVEAIRGKNWRGFLWKECEEWLSEV